MFGKLKYFLLAVIAGSIIFYLFGVFVAPKIIYPLEYSSIVIEESKNFGLDPVFVSAIIFEESKFNEKAKSSAGAIGLMQIMPETAGWIAKNLSTNDFKINNLYVPENNVKYGCWYLRFLFDKYGREDLVLAAYNGGHQNVDKWLKQEGITKDYTGEINLGYDETKHYIKKVMSTKEIYKKLYGHVLN